MMLSMIDADDVVPLPNTIPWYYICLALLVGAALLTQGVTMLTKGWENELKLPNWFSVIGQTSGIILSSLMGCLAGYIVWEWALGGMVAFVGSASSALILTLIKARLGVTKETLKDVVSDEKS